MKANETNNYFLSGEAKGLVDIILSAHNFTLDLVLCIVYGHAFLFIVKLRWT